MLNSHQILSGARTKGGIKTYVGAEYVGVPEVSLNGTSIDVEGAVEFDGVNFALTSFDASSLDNVLPNGDYVLGAVPGYEEPADRAAAEGLGLNYYVGKNAVGESLVHYFLPSQLEADVMAAGGHTTMAKARAMGTATSSEIQLLNEFEDQLERLSDPRYTGHLLEPTGVEYVLKRVYPQDNRSKRDALVGMTNPQIELFIATQGYVAAQRFVYESTDSYVTGDNGGVLAKVKRAFAYETTQDAQADVDGLEIRLDYKNGDTLSDPVDVDGDPIDYGTYTAVAVFEYYQPTYMSRGHEGTKPGIFDIYEKGDSDVLGRINPIYMARDFEVARVSAGRGLPLPALTKYAYPICVAKFTKGSGPSLSAASVYTPGTLDLV